MLKSAIAASNLLMAEIEAKVLGVGYGAGAIPADMTFRQWCDDLAARGMKIDGKPFTLDNRPALIPIYDAIPTTQEDARGKILVVQKATQLGLTVWEVLAHIYMALKFGPITIGMFMPDQATASYKSEHRFMRIVRSVPDLLRRLIFRADGEGKDQRIGEGNILTRVMGESIFLFLWTTGKVTTESRPMDIVGLDEVQEMALDHIDKVLARLGDSDIGFALMLSTANMPESDINYWYMLGTQEVWHTRCPHCDALSDLSDPAGIFPDKSIAYNNGQIPNAPLSEYAWTCPVCGGWIEDPQVGECVVHAPNASDRIRSFMLPRTISPKITPRVMIEDFSRSKTGHQKKNFYNRTLARPYIDAEQLPVTMAHCLAAAAEGMRMGLTWQTHGRDCYMGIDQMGGFNAVIIKKRLPDGRQAVVHVEAVFDLDPFARCTELMEVYGVSMCVVEQLPNVNDARRFANYEDKKRGISHRGRVFLAGYADLRDDMMAWGDQLSRSDRKTAEDDRSRYTVNLNQYKCMQTSLYRIRGDVVDGKLVPFCLFPDPDALEQDVLDNGKKVRIALCRDWVFTHFTKTALIIENEGDETKAKGKSKSAGMQVARKTRAKVAKVGIDPHYSYANMLCDVAWARNHGAGMVFFPETKPMEKDVAAIVQAVPGMPASVAAKMIDVPQEGDVCGRCTAYDAEIGRCTERGFRVKPTAPSCDIFVRRTN